MKHCYYYLLLLCMSTISIDYTLNSLRYTVNPTLNLYYTNISILLAYRYEKCISSWSSTAFLDSLLDYILYILNRIKIRGR